MCLLHACMLFIFLASRSQGDTVPGLSAMSRLPDSGVTLVPKDPLD